MSKIIKFQQHLVGAHLIRASSGAAAIEDAPKEEDLETVRKKAFEAGREEARSEARKKVSAARALQEKLFKQMGQLSEQLNDAAAEALPDLIVEGVRRIINDWKPEPDYVEKVVSGIMAGLEGDRGKVRIRLSTQDKVHFDNLLDGQWNGFSDVELLEDGGLKEGEYVVSGRFGLIDGRFEPKIKNLRKVLD